MITIEIWSDVVCPFCYIGKRHLEAALADFPARDKVEIRWRSFQLDPGAERMPTITTHEMLARKYGRTIEQARQMTEGVERMAARAGLKYDLARSIPANSFDAHRLIHIAAARGLADAAEERLFRAQMCEGLNIGDPAVLERLGAEIGLPAEEVREVLAGDRFAAEVRADIAEAAEFGITGVPLFLFNRRYAVSGAQPVEVFRHALEKAAQG